MKSFGRNTARRAARAHQGFAALGGEPLSQRAPDHPGPARPGASMRRSESFCATASAERRGSRCHR